MPICLRGRVCRTLAATNPERALVAAIVYQAARDALRGNAEAIEWMDEIGVQWLTRFLGFDEARAQNWRAVDWSVRPPADPEQQREKARARQQAHYWRKKGRTPQEDNLP